MMRYYYHPTATWSLAKCIKFGVIILVAMVVIVWLSKYIKPESIIPYTYLADIQPDVDTGYSRN